MSCAQPTILQRVFQSIVWIVCLRIWGGYSSIFRPLSRCELRFCKDARDGAGLPIALTEEDWFIKFAIQLNRIDVAACELELV